MPARTGSVASPRPDEVSSACRRGAPPIKKRLNYSRYNMVMRVAMSAVVALLILNFVDEHFNDARYTRAAMVMFSSIVRSFG
jgi:hypothetical protein